MDASFIVIGLTRLGIKPKSTAREANALSTWPSELLPLCQCGEQLASLLVVPFGRALSGIPHLGVVDRWPVTPIAL